MPDSDGPAADRIVRALPPGTRTALERDLPPTDLQTLLIAVARARASQVTAADVLRRWQQDRFVRPAPCDPRRLSAVEARLWELLPAEFAGLELSPVAPLGTCSALGPVSQNRVVTTVRGTEVVSDSSNALAVEAALRRRSQPRDGQVHLAACHRLLRAQDFGPGWSAHFRLLTLVSSARDTGSGRTEADLLTRHLRYWLNVLETLIPHRQPQVELSVFDDPVLAERLADTVRPALGAGAALLADKPDRTRARGYYARFALRITADDGQAEIGDGGLTTWTAQLTSNAKERCLVSCLATEQLTVLASALRHPRRQRPRPQVGRQPPLGPQVDHHLLAQRLRELEVTRDLVRRQVPLGDLAQQLAGLRPGAGDRPLDRHVANGGHQPLDHEAEPPGGCDQARLARPGPGQDPGVPARMVLVPDRHGKRAPVRAGRHREGGDVRLGQEELTVAIRQGGICHNPEPRRGPGQRAPARPGFPAAN